MENSEKAVSEIREFIISRGDDNLRLDIFLTEQTEYTRSYIQKLIKQDRILLDDKPVKKSGQPVCAGQTITVSFPPAATPDKV